MIAVVDYSLGNLFSLSSSLTAIGQAPVVTADPAVIAQADRIILPGVGAFEDAVKKLKERNLISVLQKEAATGKPLLGICLGMQLLFEESFEYGRHQGLGLIPGRVCPLEKDLPEGYKVPHMGWNSLYYPRESPLFRDIPEHSYVYFVHSYYAKDCSDSLIAAADYGIPVTAAVQRDNVYGTQFHPEKSGNRGLAILRNFCAL